jgi:hypothetical protein
MHAVVQRVEEGYTSIRVTCTSAAGRKGSRLDVINRCLKSTRYLLYVKGEIFLSCLSLIRASQLTAVFALLRLQSAQFPSVHQVREFLITCDSGCQR